MKTTKSGWFAKGLSGTVLLALTVVLTGTVACGGACSDSEKCDGGGSWRTCHSGDDIWFATSDGKEDHCKSKDDCDAATTAVASWCDSH